MKSPFISRVIIKNFRNFKDLDVKLGHKPVIIGENNVGKSNFIHAIRLILDPSFSDQDRNLTENDFHESIAAPFNERQEIIVMIEVQGYEFNRKLIANFVDAVVSDSPPTLRFTYSFKPVIDEHERLIRYEYKITQGRNDEKIFNSSNRSYLNIRVVKAIRDVEREFSSYRNSPLVQLIKTFDIEESELGLISEELKNSANAILELNEVKEIKKSLQSTFDRLSGLQYDAEINLRTFDIDPLRLLNTMQVYMGVSQRPISEISVGLANVLYLSLILLLIRDKTIPSFLKKSTFEGLVPFDNDKLLPKFYSPNEYGDYDISSELTLEDQKVLYTFFEKHYDSSQSTTILVVEEPESHLHPTLQRLIYREILHKSETSVLFTSHSTHITSVAPIESIVHIARNEDTSEARSTIELNLTESEKTDLERYLDVKRGEIYFGKGIILVEGVAEEYIVPMVADIMNFNLETYGINVININSTNFRPYLGILNRLKIPWVVISDGDYYRVNSDGDKEFHVIADSNDANYNGVDNLSQILTGLGVMDDIDFLMSEDHHTYLREYGCFLGMYTLEVDLMFSCQSSGELNIVKTVFNEIRTGGERMQNNFETAIDEGRYWEALRKIEGSGMGKGRFAQSIAPKLTLTMVPSYITEGIEYIIRSVTNE